MSAKFCVIYLATSNDRAEAMRQVLDQAGICALALTGTLDPAEFEPLDWIVQAAEENTQYTKVAVKVAVRQDDALVARKLVLDTENGWRSATVAAPELVLLDTEAGRDQAWPLCPHCARPRLATCPVCQTSGTDFHAAFLAESNESSVPGGDFPESDRSLVLCPTCDEPFIPRHPARCEWCGHRFSDGDEPRPTAPPVYSSLIEDLNPRAIFVLVAMFVTMATVIGWFFYVLR